MPVNYDFRTTDWSGYKPGLTYEDFYKQFFPNVQKMATAGALALGFDPTQATRQAYAAYSSDPSRMSGPNPESAFSPDLINQYFNIAEGNLNQMGGNAAARARSNAGSLLYGRALNPSAAIANAGNQAAAPYVGQIGNLEASRAGALQGNDLAKYNAIFNLWNAQNQFGLQNRALDYQTQGPNALDWISALAKLGIGVGSLFA